MLISEISNAKKGSLGGYSITEEFTEGDEESGSDCRFGCNTNILIWYCFYSDSSFAGTSTSDDQIIWRRCLSATSSGTAVLGDGGVRIKLKSRELSDFRSMASNQNLDVLHSREYYRTQSCKVVFSPHTMEETLIIAVGGFPMIYDASLFADRNINKI